jgi:hypothetical protein
VYLCGKKIAIKFKHKGTLRKSTKGHKGRSFVKFEGTPETCPFYF